MSNGFETRNASRNKERFWSVIWLSNSLITSVSNTAYNTVISPNFLVWKFCGKTENFLIKKICR